MNIATAIVKQRKKFGWSQEELASQLDVSRQSVSKWESGQSIPDLDKIARLADLFDVSTDYLIRGGATSDTVATHAANKTTVNLVEASNYIDAKYQSSKIAMKGVALSICSPMPLIMLLAGVRGGVLELSQTTAVAIGIVSILALVASAISFFVRSSQMESDMRDLSTIEFSISPTTRAAMQTQQQAFASIYTKQISLGVMLFILSAAPLLLVAILLGEVALVVFAMSLIFPICAAVVALVAPASAKRDAIELVLKEGDLDKGKSESVKNSEKLGAF